MYTNMELSSKEARFLQKNKEPSLKDRVHTSYWYTDIQGAWCESLAGLKRQAVFSFRPETGPSKPSHQ